MSTADEVVAETFKVLVLGGSDVGKTSIVRFFTSGGQVPANLLPTVGKTCPAPFIESLILCVTVYGKSCLIDTIYVYLFAEPCNRPVC